MLYLILKIDVMNILSGVRKRKIEDSLTASHFFEMLLPGFEPGSQPFSLRNIPFQKSRGLDDWPDYTTEAQLIPQTKTRRGFQEIFSWRQKIFDF